MKIGNILKEENIIFIDPPVDKSELIKLLIDKVICSNEEIKFNEKLKCSFFDGVFDRESKGTTGLGDEIAFPHGRIDGLNRPIIALGIAKAGVDFDAPDDKLAKIIFLFLFPGNRHEMGVKIQSVFARFLMSNAHIEKILSSTTPAEVQQLIINAELKIDTPVTAQDLMVGIKLKLTDNMVLQDAMTLMDKFHAEVAPVVDDNGKLIGEIDCIHLFQMELPDYIKKLNSVPPIHDFDPFAKYFADGASLIVKDAMNESAGRVELNASMFEIIFLLSVKKHSVVYVCDDDIVVGIIDRITVLNKVFNL